MKKYLCFVLILALMFTMVTPFGVKADSHSDMIEYFGEKQVNPYMFSGAFQSFISYENISEGYVLRNSEESEMVCEEIATFLSSYGVTTDEISPYVSDFFAYFSDKPDLFKVFMSFVINTENIILPFTKQDAFTESVPGAAATIKDNFYSETLFFNYLSKISESYQENKSTMAIKLVDERLIFEGDVQDYINFIEPSDGIVASSAISILTNVLDIINDGDQVEKLDFSDYLILLGMISLNMDDSTSDDDPSSTIKYNNLYSKYAEGNDKVDAFYNIDDIVNEYTPLIKDASSQYDKNNYISQAMSKATTVRIKSRNITNGTKAEIFFNDPEILEFAAVCGKKVRSEFKKNGISVSKNQSYDLRIEFDSSAEFKGFSVEIPYSIIDVFEGVSVSKVVIASQIGNYVINCTTFKNSDLVYGDNITFGLTYGSADELIPGLEIYAQGSEVMNVQIFGNSECLEHIPYGAMRFEKNISGKESEYGENNIYSIAADGEREKVSRYGIVDSVIAFEIGEGRNFVKIDGELTKPNPNAPSNPTPTPTPTPNPSNGNSGSTWVDDGNEENETTTTPAPDEKDEQEKEDDTKPATKPQVNFDDVPDSHWAKAYIADLAGKGILSGVGNNKFNPDANVTREQFAKILTMAFGIVNENATCDFTDVDSESWYAVYVASAYEKGIINGIGGNKFGTGQNISREDAATMIARAANVCGVDLGEKSTFTYNDEAHISDYAYDAVKILAGCGAISGYVDNTFKPKNPSSRAQVAKIVSEVLKYKK